jgi:type II secretion system protein N
VKKIRESRYFIPVSSALFLIAVFLFTFYSSLPGEAFKQRIIFEIEKRAPFKVTINKLNISPIIRLKVYGVTVYRDKEPILNIDELKLNPSFIYLVVNKLGIPFEASLYGGQIEGKVVYSLKTKDIVRAQGEIENGINIERSRLVSALLGSGPGSVQGILRGDFSLEFGSQPKGNINLTVDDLLIKGVTVAGGFPLPDLGKMKSSFKGRIENGLTKVEELKLNGDKLDVSLSGTMPVLWQISHKGTIDLNVKLRAVGGAGKTMTGLLGAFLTKQRDGTLGGKIVGPISRPNIVKHVINNR